MDGYAALHRKFAFDKYPRKLLLNPPGALPELEGLGFEGEPRGAYQLIFAFVFSLGEMEARIRETDAGGLLEEGGCLYLAYPKKGNREYGNYIGRDDIFPALGVNEEDGFVGGTALKFCKMAALNETFTVVGLRRFSSGAPPKKNTGGRAEDYAGRIPELRKALEGRPETLAAYDALPPGYRKDWARQVYSLKTEAARERRLAEMAGILAAGYKSRDRYRLRKNRDGN
jgi:hypothetical protein